MEPASNAITPRLYHFTPEQVAMAALADESEFGRIFHPEGNTANTDLFILQCKIIDSVYSKRVTDSQYSLKSCHAYFYFLIDIYRHEEAYKLAVECANRHPDHYDMPFIAAAMREDLEAAKSYLPGELKPDSNFREWMIYIIYHDINGTLCEVAANGPLPLDVSLRALIMLYSRNDVEAYRLLKGEEKLKDQDKWTLFAACVHTNRTVEAESYLQQLMADCQFYDYYHQRKMLDMLHIKLTDKELKRAYFLRFIEKRPASLAARRILAATNPNDARKFCAQIKSLYELFPTIELKRLLILSGPLPLSNKATVLAMTTADNLTLTHLNAIGDLMSLDNRPSFKAYEPYIDTRPAIRQEYTAVLTKEVSKLDNEKQREALCVVEKGLAIVPHSRNLLCSKAQLHSLLCEPEALEKALHLLFSHYGYIPFYANLGYKLYILKGDKEKALECLKNAYRDFPDKDVFNLLTSAIKEHADRETFIRFLIDNIRHVSNYNELEDCVCGSDKKEEYAVELLKVARENIWFVEMRVGILIEAKLYKETIEDYKWLVKSNPGDEKYKICLFEMYCRLEKYVEATEFYLGDRFEITDYNLNAIISELHYSEARFDLIVKLYDRLKSRLNSSSRFIATCAFQENGDYIKALQVVNQLFKELPMDRSVRILRIDLYLKIQNYGMAIDLCTEWLKEHPNDMTFMESLAEAKNQLNRKPEDKKPEPAAPVKRTVPPVNPARVPYLIDEKKEKGSVRAPDEKKSVEPVHVPRIKEAPRNLRSMKGGVDPLKPGYSLDEIKKIAAAGERSAHLIPRAKPPAPALVQKPAAEPVHAIVKTHLRETDKTFLSKGLEVYKLLLEMRPALLDEKTVFNNYIYTILRLFTPIRLNATQESLQLNLARIRNDARHRSDLCEPARLKALFAYLNDIKLSEKLTEWISGHGLITKLALSNHTLTESTRVDISPAVARTKFEAELAFIAKLLTTKSAWNDQIYLHNAIKASIAIIGEVSHCLDPQPSCRKFLIRCREEGNRIAHQFLETVNTPDATFVYEDDIDPDALWDLAHMAKQINH